MKGHLQPAVAAVTPGQTHEVFSLLRELHERIESIIEATADRVVQDGLSQKEFAACARNIGTLGRKRKLIFRTDLFGEPAWDMLLELYIAAMEGRSESVSDVHYSSALPLTTTIRWLSALEREGWLFRRRDPEDKRRTFVCISTQGLAAMDEFFSQPEFVRIQRPVRAARLSNVPSGPRLAVQSKVGARQPE